MNAASAVPAFATRTLIAHRGVGRIFCELDKAGGKGPGSLAGLDTAADEEHLAFLLDDHAGSHLVIAEEDPVAGGAKAARAPKGLPVLKGMAAAGAIVQLGRARQAGLSLEVFLFLGAHRPSVRLAHFGG